MCGASLADLRSGKETRFEGPFPAEIEPLAKELNALLESNQADHRAGAHPGRQPRPCAEDAAQRHHQRGARRRGPLADKVAEQARAHADAGQPLPRTGADRRPLEGDRRGDRGRAGGRRLVARHEPHPRGHGHRPRRRRADGRRSSAARSRISRRSSATSSTMPANGRRREVAIAVDYAPPPNEERPARLAFTSTTTGPA